MGAAIFLMDDQSHMLWVCMEFVTYSSGKFCQLVIRHRSLRIKGDMTQTIGQVFPFSFLHGIL
ncbi:hypothetical protein [Acetobacter indonesiensis]